MVSLQSVNSDYLSVMAALMLINFVNNPVYCLLEPINTNVKFQKVNYPVFYSKAEGKYEEALSYCKEIEEQFGRESVSVKTRLKSASDEVIYSTPVISKGVYL